VAGVEDDEARKGAALLAPHPGGRGSSQRTARGPHQGKANRGKTRRRRSRWPARNHTRAWIVAEYGEEVWAVVEDAMAKRRPA
jgi:hypothetical protein